MLSATTDRFFGYYPGTVALITAAHDGQRNVMAAGWHTALSADPPLYGVAVGRERATHALIRAGGTFGVNFLPSPTRTPCRARACTACTAAWTNTPC